MMTRTDDIGPSEAAKLLGISRVLKQHGIIVNSISPFPRKLERA